MSYLLTFLFLLSAGPAVAGWNLNNSLIPPEEIRSGGPPKDGIPALFEPRFIPAVTATKMRSDERVLGVVLDGIAKAYPLRILSWHELVNDRFGPLPVLVSW